jgi:hypothetical protein
MRLLLHYSVNSISKSSPRMFKLSLIFLQIVEDYLGYILDKGGVIDLFGADLRFT